MSDLGSLLDLARELGVALDFEEYASLIQRLEGDPRISIIGLVSRGKSTLVNQLTGVDLMPVNAIGETAARVTISSGTPSFWRRHEDGSIAMSAVSPDVARAMLLRSASPLITEAHFSWPCRLPHGLSLVDTPGYDDVHDELAYLDQHWKRTGSVGTIAVVSVPPGLAAKDRQLLETAQRVVGRGLSIAVKPIDSSVTLEALDDVSALVREWTGISPVIVGHVSEPGVWGHGDLAALETRIAQLAARAEASREEGKARLGELESLITTAISQFGVDGLRKLQSLSPLAVKCPSGVRNTLESRIAEIEREQSALALQRQAEAERQRMGVLEAQAKEFAKLLSAASSQGPISAHELQILKELVPLAAKGSESARLAIASVLNRLLPQQRKSVRLDVEALLRLAPPTRVIDIIAPDLSRAPIMLTHPEVPLLAALALDAQRMRLVRRLISNSLESFSLEQLRELLNTSARNNSEVRHDIEAAYVDRTRRELSERLRRTSGAEVMEAFAALKDLYDTELESLRRAADLLTPANADSLRASIEQGRLAAADIAETRCRQHMQSLIARRTLGPGDPIGREVSAFKPFADWLGRISRSSSTASLAESFAPGGILHTLDARVEEAISDAKRRAARSDTLARTGYVLSFILWAISGALLAFNTPTAVSVWVASFVLWLTTRERADEHQPWQPYYVSPAIPSADESLSGNRGIDVPDPSVRSGAGRATSRKFVGGISALVVVAVLASIIAVATRREPETPASTRAPRGEASSEGGNVGVRTTPPATIFVAPSTTRSQPPVTTAAPTSTSSTTISLPASGHPYFDALTRWTLDGTLQMQELAAFRSPAWAYGRHLEQSLRAGGGKLSTTFTPTSPDTGDFCIGSTCFAITDITLQGDEMYTFNVKGTSLDDMSTAWTTDDAPIDCWHDGAYSGCPGANAVTMRLTTIYTVGETTWVSVEVDAGSLVTPDSGPRLARIRTFSGSLDSNSFFGSGPISQGGLTVWLFKFSGVTNPEVTEFTVFLGWDGSEYDWTFSSL